MRGTSSCAGSASSGRSHEDLGAHEVDAGNLLGDGVFDLNAGVHLDEEPLLAVEVVEEFNRAGIVVTNPAGDPDRRIAELAADSILETDRGSDFDHLLVAALNRTIALVQMENVPVVVAENLHLDVLCAGNVFLKKDCGISKRPAGLALGLVQQRREIGFLEHDTHPSAATAKRRLDDQREADFFCDFESFRAIRNRVLGAGECGDI